jgi:phosphoribosylformylglycinamidine cyclo-ligase
VPRVLPANLSARIDLSSWQLPPVFNWLQQSGNVEQMEMLRTFNCGVGMLLAIDAQQEQQCLDQLQALGETAWVIGDIVTRGDQAAVVFT